MPFASKLLYEDVPPVEDILKELYDRIRSERDAINQTLMECFKDKPVRNSSNNDNVNVKIDPEDLKYAKLEDEYLELRAKNLGEIKKLLKKVLKQQRLDAMPTLEDVKEGRVKVSEETVMAIIALEEELKQNLEKNGLENVAKYPHIDLRPKTKTKHPFSIDDPLFNYDFLFKKDDESNESKLEKESTKEIRFKNNFDDTPEGEVYDHFYAGFIYEKGRDRQKDYLSESDLDKFLKAAFEDKKPLKKLFTFKNHKTKAQIYKPFHTYFKVVAVKRKRTEAEKKKGTDAALYASLLEDYFRNWTSVQANFNRYTKDD